MFPVLLSARSTSSRCPSLPSSKLRVTRGLDIVSQQLTIATYTAVAFLPIVLDDSIIGCCPSVFLTVTLCIVALRVGVGG